VSIDAEVEEIHLNHHQFDAFLLASPLKNEVVVVILRQTLVVGTAHTHNNSLSLSFCVCIYTIHSLRQSLNVVTNQR